MSQPDQIVSDRNSIYVVIAYQRPPPSLMMHLAESGKSWFKRATGAYAAQIVEDLRRHKISGRVLRKGPLPGTDGWIPPNRTPNTESSGLRDISPAEFARRSYKGPVTTFNRSTGEIIKTAPSGHGAPAQTVAPPLDRAPKLSAFRELTSSPSSPSPRQARLRASGRTSREAKRPNHSRVKQMQRQDRFLQGAPTFSPPIKRFPRWSRT